MADSLKQRTFSALGAACAVCVCWWILVAPVSAAPLYVLKAWQTEDGLPDNRVTSVVQTRDGYIWLGTLGGLARFDGVRFKVFDGDVTEGLLTGPVTSLFEDRQGTLWIGYETGELVRYDPAKGFKVVPVPANWSNRKILGISDDDSGDIWLVNAEGLLMRVRDGMVLAPRLGLALGPLVSFARSASGLLVSRNGAASLLERNRLITPGFANQSDGEYVQGICPGRSGGIWVVNNQRIREWRDQAWVEDRGLAPWGAAPIVSMIETRNGALAASTSEQGLFLVFSNREFLKFDLTNGFPSDWVRSLCEDREGNVWAGTGSRGVAALRPGTILNLTPPDRWQGCAVLSVCPSQNGGLWVGTDGAGLYRYQSGQWSNFARSAGLPNYFIWSVSEDAKGHIWAGTWGGGLITSHGGPFFRVPGLENMLVPTPAVLHSKNGGLWVGTSIGLLHVQEGRTNWYGEKQGLILPDVRAIVEDPAGGVWFGMFGGGLGHLETGNATQVRKRDGLAGDLVQCLRLDPDGTLWIGTFGGGISRLRRGRFSTISKAQGLLNTFIFDMEDDGHGYFWMSTRKGILKISKSELNLCADGEISRVHCLSYGTSDGLPTLECSGGGQPAGCRTPDGRLWFATSKGLVGVDPSQIKTNTLAPPVVIEKILLDDRDWMSEPFHPSSVRVPPGRHRLEFQYTGLSYVAPEKVQFKCQLDGFEPQWVDAGTRRSAIYSYTPPGEYVFRVTACNNDGKWNETGASLSVIILPFFWQTWWFRALTGAMMVGAGGAVMWLDARRRMRRKLERIERQQAVERERARIAKDIHDDLGASLTRITLLSDSDRGDVDVPSQVRGDLDEIRKTSRELTTAMAEVVWAINPQYDTLDSLATYLEKYGQDFLRTAGVLCRLEMPGEFPPWTLTSEMRHNLFLAFKEALHNVVKHASASEARILLALEPAAFRLVVEDNGRGFDPNVQRQHPQDSGSGRFNGNGLPNMRQRLAEVGGHCEIRSVPGKGTFVEFFVPMRSAPA